MTWSLFFGSLAGIAGVLTVIGGAYKVYKDSQGAREASALSGFNDLVGRLQEDVKRLGEEASRDRERIAALEKRDEVRQTRIRQLLDYIVYLQRFIGEHAPGSKPAPVPDEGTTNAWESYYATPDPSPPHEG